MLRRRLQQQLRGVQGCDSSAPCTRANCRLRAPAPPAPPPPRPPPVNRRMDQWVDTADFDLDTVEVQLEEVGPDGK